MVPRDVSRGAKISVAMSRRLEQLDDGLLDLVHAGGRLEARDQVALAVDEELGEVPADVGLVAELLAIGCGELLQGQVLDALTKASKRLLGCQVGKEGDSRVTVDVNLLELGELGAELERAELRDLIVGLGCLVGELVAGEVKNLEALLAMSGVDSLEVLVLRRKAAPGRGVHDEQNLARVLGERDLAAVLGCHCVVKVTHERSFRVGSRI